MQLGLDSYSYHRLLGEIRVGEDEPGWRFPRGSSDVLAAGAALAVDVVALETCFLPPPAELPVRAYRHEASGLQLVLSWGHPDGLEYGASTHALEDLLAWIALAPDLGCELVRIVAASPRVQRTSGALERTAEVLARSCQAARIAGVELALENHADLTAAEIEALLEAVGDSSLGVCLDTANALRVGDDPVAAVRILAAHIRIVHLKDVAGDLDDRLTGPRSVPFGTGCVPLDEILQSLRDSGFGGPVCVELGHLGPGPVDERDLVNQGIGWLRAAFDRDAGAGG